MSEPVLITTAIDYTNAPPHLGHAYEKIAADAVARYHRLRGDDVFFLTGTDEHGLKIERAASAKGVEPQAFVDEMAGKFAAAWEALGVAPDRFIRTTDPDHEEAVGRVFARLLEQGDISKAVYEGLYCAGCEEFKNERDLVDGKCPQHDAAPVPYKEENYVLRVGKYKERIRAHIESHPGFIRPASRKAEILNLLETFPDVSVSRQKLKWGIPVPGDPEQRIYVWVDALLNYLTGIGYTGLAGAEAFPSEKAARYWPARWQIVGKDITKFHCIIWPALLMALDLPLPATVYGHGWVNVGESKMSKSLGNVVEPVALAERYGADALRYFLLREITFGKDGSYTEDGFRLRVNADLANNFGNALNRTLGLLEKNFGAVVPGDRPTVSAPLAEAARALVAAVEAHMAALELQETLEAIWGYLDVLNKFIDTEAPWALAKAGDTERLAGVLYGVLEGLRVVALLVSPFVPALAARMWDQLGQDAPLASRRWDALAWGGLAEGTVTRKAGPLYPRIDDELATAGAKKKGAS